MSRRLKVSTREMGMLELLLIYNEAGTWESEWRPMQTVASFADLLPQVSKDQMEHALLGWTRPLVDALGPPPSGTLVKLPVETRRCVARASCPFYRPRDCVHSSSKMPWCFVPDGFGTDEEIRRLAAEAVRLWRDGVYIVLVLEPADAQR